MMIENLEIKVKISIGLKLNLRENKLNLIFSQENRSLKSRIIRSATRCRWNWMGWRNIIYSMDDTFLLIFLLLRLEIEIINNRAADCRNIFKNKNRRNHFLEITKIWGFLKIQKSFLNSGNKNGNKIDGEDDKTQ